MEWPITPWSFEPQINIVAAWFTQPSACVCVVVLFVAFFGLAANLFLFEHRAKAVATQAASVSLDMLTHPGLRIQ
jgi:hypothetical protein